jgi:hypothetical protein
MINYAADYTLRVTDAGWYRMGWVSTPHRGYVCWVDYYVHYAGCVRADWFPDA